MVRPLSKARLRVTKFTVHRRERHLQTGNPCALLESISAFVVNITPTSGRGSKLPASRRGDVALNELVVITASLLATPASAVSLVCLAVSFGPQDPVTLQGIEVLRQNNDEICSRINSELEVQPLMKGIPDPHHCRSCASALLLGCWQLPLE